MFQNIAVFCQNILVMISKTAFIEIKPQLQKWKHQNVIRKRNTRIADSLFFYPRIGTRCNSFMITVK